MKGIFNKALMLALLVSVSGMNAGIGSYFKQSCTFAGQALANKVKNHPYMSGFALTALAYEAGMRYYGLTHWTLSHGVSVASKKLAEMVKSLRPVTVAAAEASNSKSQGNKNKRFNPLLKGKPLPATPVVNSTQASETVAVFFLSPEMVQEKARLRACLDRPLMINISDSFVNDCKRILNSVDFEQLVVLAKSFNSKRCSNPGLCLGQIKALLA